MAYMISKVCKINSLLSVLQWAFGVTCWEIFSGGKVPYAGINPVDLPQMLDSGYRMIQCELIAIGIILN